MPFDKRYTPDKTLAASKLFEPIKVGNLTVKHRVVLSPLTRLRNHHNVPDVPLLKEYYSQRSTREGTLIVTEGTFISAAAGGYTTAPGVYTDEHVEKWSDIFEGIHKNKSFVFQQLWALGWSAWPDILKAQGLKYVSASEDHYYDENVKKVAIESGNPQHSLTKDEIKQYIDDFVSAAKNSLRAGADGVEIHAANGYLLNQFLDPNVNKRTDEYGGSIENRSRFTLEVVDALVEAIGPEKVAIRLSPFGEFGSMSGIEEPSIVAQFAHVIGELEKRGRNGKRLAYLHVMEPRAANVHTASVSNTTLVGSNEFIYSIWDGILIRAGDYASHPKETIADVAKGKTLIGYGRYYISNPDFPDRLEKALPLNAYDRASFYKATSEGYTDYPKYEDAVNDQAFLNDDLSKHVDEDYLDATRRST